MKKLLAIVYRKDGGWRGYVPRLPGCETYATTPEKAEADVRSAARAHLAANKEGPKGFRADEAEIIVVVEPPQRCRGDGLDDISNESDRGTALESLDMLVNPEDYEWLTDEEFMAELDLLEKNLTTGATPP